MRLIVHQPQFMPWIGMWVRLAAAQKWVVYAGVKADFSDHQHRVTLWDDLWVGMQVGKAQRNCLIKDVQIQDHTSLRKLAKTLQQAFGKKPYGHRLDGLIHLFETTQLKFMLDLDLAVMLELLTFLSFPVEIVIDTKERSHLEKLEKLQDCVEEHGAGADYYMGRGGLDYMTYDDLPGHRIYVQEMVGQQSPHSIVQLIALVEDPVDAIEQSFVWVGKENDRHFVFDGERHDV